MDIETQIRALAHNKVRVHITKRRRNARGFYVVCPDGTKTYVPSRQVGLQLLLAVARCMRQQTWSLVPVKWARTQPPSIQDPATPMGYGDLAAIELLKLGLPEAPPAK